MWRSGKDRSGIKGWGRNKRRGTPDVTDKRERERERETRKGWGERGRREIGRGDREKENEETGKTKRHADIERTETEAVRSTLETAGKRGGGGEGVRGGQTGRETHRSKRAERPPTPSPRKGKTTKWTREIAASHLYRTHKDEQKKKWGEGEP